MSTYLDELKKTYALDNEDNPALLEACAEVDSLRQTIANLQSHIRQEDMRREEVSQVLKNTGAALVESQAKLAACEREREAARKEGIRRFPGFGLREERRIQYLSFSWIDAEKKHRTVEISNYDTHPMMVAAQLRSMADGIMERVNDPNNSPTIDAAKGQP